MTALFDPRDPSVRTDPYPLYRKLRESDPVHRSNFGYWILSRYADVDAVLRAPGASSEFYRDPTWANRRGGPESPLVRSVRKWMLMLDGPAHRRIRGVIGKVFTRAAVERLRPRIAAETDRLLDAVGEGDTDLIQSLALPLPTTVTCELLGLPTSDRDQCRRWTEQISRVIDPSITAADAVDMNAAEVEFREYVAGHLEERRSTPRDDILSLLLHAEADGGRLTEEEIIANVQFLFVAGHETTVNLIGNGLLALLRHPDQLRIARDNPETIAGAMDEISRYDPPVQIVSRLLTENLPLQGITLPEGAKVMLLFGAAGRDPERYPDPDRLDLARTGVKTLAFSGGPHYCVGAALGKLETSMVLTELVRRYSTIELTGDDLVWRPNVSFRGLEELPLRLVR
ncbi:MULTISPECIES: cytochrome P450 [Streptomyces]|uniref:Cytochrome P450 n=1 Tax=Streptomyces lonegramiae TaxID=3075524 RepID=A0ABU2X967_9ACTN|nr:cytochrome P450 [Streptomyces sp. DSM 41529]MDT0541922.1 cytochrome P450 [Streptomyces sp. DSM 41529]